MDVITDLLKLLIPAGLVLYGMYLVVLSFLKKEREKVAVSLKQQHTQQTLPLRLQAAERFALLLERMRPAQLLSRHNTAGLTAAELHSLMVKDLREEFQHNVSQQVYVSDESWGLVKAAKEEVLGLINQAYQETGKEAGGTDLAKALFQLDLKHNSNMIDSAQRSVKEEIRTYY